MITWSLTASSANESVALLQKVNLPRLIHFFRLENFPGIGQGRITGNLGTFVKHISGALHISDEKTIPMLYELLDTEGLYIGASSALNVAAAVELAQKLGPGMFPMWRRAISGI